MVSKEKKIEMRKKAYYTMELTKGIMISPENRTANTMVEMAGYVLELTQDVAEEAFQQMLNGM